MQNRKITNTDISTNTEICDETSDLTINTFKGLLQARFFQRRLISSYEGSTVGSGSEIQLSAG